MYVIRHSTSRRNTAMPLFGVACLTGLIAAAVELDCAVSVSRGLVGCFARIDRFADGLHINGVPYTEHAWMGCLFGWGAKSVGLSACLREWLREQLNIRAGRAGQVCCSPSSRPLPDARERKKESGHVPGSRHFSWRAPKVESHVAISSTCTPSVGIQTSPCMGCGAVGGGTSRKKQGTVTPVHNLACQRLHQILKSSWSNQTLGAIGEWGAPRLDPGTGCSLAALRTLALSRRASKTTLRSPPLCMREYSMDGTVRVTAPCGARVRVGACTAQGSRWVVGFVCMLQVESRPSGPPLPYWLPIQEQEQHQADSPFHTRRLPKASHDAAIDGDTDTHVPDNSPPDGPRDGMSRRKVPSMCVRLLTDTCTEWQQHCRSVSWTAPVSYPRQVFCVRVYV